MVVRESNICGAAGVHLIKASRKPVLFIFTFPSADLCHQVQGDDVGMARQRLSKLLIALCEITCACLCQ